jgi:hypothetical protein
MEAADDRGMALSAARQHDCPTPPPSRKSTHAKAVHRACVILGGADRLAARLNVAEATARGWMEGREDPPEEVFLACVEILLLHLEAPGSAN